MRSCGIPLRVILQEIPQPSVTEISLKITYLKFCSNLPGASELNLFVLFKSMPWNHGLQFCYHLCFERNKFNWFVICVSSWNWPDVVIMISGGMHTISDIHSNFKIFWVFVFKQVICIFLFFSLQCSHEWNVSITGAIYMTVWNNEGIKCFQWKVVVFSPIFSCSKSQLSLDVEWDWQNKLWTGNVRNQASSDMYICLKKCFVILLYPSVWFRP